MKRFLPFIVLIMMIVGCTWPIPTPQPTYTPLPTYTPYPTFPPPVLRGPRPLRVPLALQRRDPRNLRKRPHPARRVFRGKMPPHILMKLPA